jgi:membrane-associated phospholipid phosphatase
MSERPGSAQRAHSAQRLTRSSAIRAALVSLAALAVVTVGAAAPACVAAQSPDEPIVLRWWHPLAAGAGFAALIFVDEPVHHAVQEVRTNALDDFGDITSDFKNREVFLVSSGGAIALGLLAGEPKVTVTGLHILAAYGLSSGIMIGTKWAFGRSRPSQTPDDPASFAWFDGGEDSAFPSGSAAVVFSLATTLADAIDGRPASVVLYSAAVVNAWARMNSERHWLSDVAIGGLIGVTAAKLVNGEWTVFGLRPPAIWTDGRSTSMGYTIGF